ncbi:MAG: hypothetical protein JO074_02870 [Frankiales bacterium]|nr:hypothetical protein [Frankiales bacterium]
MAASPAPRGARQRANTPEPASELYRVAYEEGQRLLDDQLDELASMRTRSVQFLAFIGTASGILVAAGLRLTERDAWYYALAAGASALSLCMVVLTVQVLLGVVISRTHPAADGLDDLSGGVVQARAVRPHLLLWRFRFAPEQMVKWLDLVEAEVGRPSANDTRRDLELDQQDMANANLSGLRVLRRLYVLLISAGALQLALWAVLIWARG